jgi:hypothetical protein
VIAAVKRLQAYTSDHTAIGKECVAEAYKVSLSLVLDLFFYLYFMGWSDSGSVGIV